MNILLCMFMWCQSHVNAFDINCLMSNEPYCKNIKWIFFYEYLCDIKSISIPLILTAWCQINGSLNMSNELCLVNVYVMSNLYQYHWHQLSDIKLTLLRNMLNKYISIWLLLFHAHPIEVFGVGGWVGGWGWGLEVVV